MRGSNWSPQPWHLVPMKPGSSDTLGRVEIVIISILAMLVLGLLAVAFVPRAKALRIATSQLTTWRFSAGRVGGRRLDALIRVKHFFHRRPPLSLCPAAKWFLHRDHDGPPFFRLGVSRDPCHVRSIVAPMIFEV
jgi:hypothetical protein